MTLPPKEIKLTDEQKAKGFPEKPFTDPFRKPKEEEIAAAQEFRDRLLHLAGNAARLTQEQHDLVLAWRHEEACRLNNDNKGLAAALIVQGRFEEAMQADPDRADECAELLIACYRPDDERCDCPDQEIQEERRTLIKPSEYVVRRQYLPHLNAFAYLIRCGQCGQLNLAVNPAQPVKQWHNTRMQAMAHARLLPKK